MSIPLDLYGFYPYTKNSTYLSHTLESQFQMQLYVKPMDFHFDLLFRLSALYAQRLRMTVSPL